MSACVIFLCGAATAANRFCFGLYLLYGIICISLSFGLWFWVV